MLACQVDTLHNPGLDASPTASWALKFSIFRLKRIQSWPVWYIFNVTLTVTLGMKKQEKRRKVLLRVDSEIEIQMLWSEKYAIANILCLVINEKKIWPIQK